MFSVSLVTLDSYQSIPIPGLDATFSEFRGTEIRHVPVIRIFGSTTSGKLTCNLFKIHQQIISIIIFVLYLGMKTCLHIHGAFPYMYIPCSIDTNIDSFVYKLAAAIDSAINVSLGSAMSNTQHVYKIQQVSGM